VTQPKLTHPGENVASKADRAGVGVWDFALAVYAGPGVEAACLRLQDRSGLDVTMLLFCLWCGFTGPGSLSESAMAAALRTVRLWGGGVTAPLRAARRALKDEALGADAARIGLRAAVIEAERRSERIMLEVLAVQDGAALPGPRGEAAARANLALYCRTAVRAPDTDLPDTDLDVLVAAARSVDRDEAVAVQHGQHAVPDAEPAAAQRQPPALDGLGDPRKRH
jgi:uncharacterized protein (TIGR02444 family)